MKNIVTRRTFLKAAAAGAVAGLACQGVSFAAEGIKDGVYTGTAPGYSWLTQMTCQVTIDGGKITDIQIVEESDSQTGEWITYSKDAFIQRIIDAQSIGVDLIGGATGSTAGIRQCVANALEAAGADPDDWDIEQPASENTVVFDGYDVVVVGLGGSGILSYCAAADQGASVFGLERAYKLGGNSSCTTGPMAINSKYLADKLNGGEDYIDGDAVYKTWIDYVESEDKADVIAEAVYASGEALDYYVDKFGFSFGTDRSFSGSFVVPDWKKLWISYDGENGTRNLLGPNKTYQFMRAMDIALGMNPKNDYLNEVKVEELIFDENGKVAGVRGTYYDGTTIEVYAKSVILATGGYLGNAKMMDEYLGGSPSFLGVTLCQGNGINMGLSAGAGTYAMKTLPMIHISQIPFMVKNDELTAEQKAILSALALTSDMPRFTVEGKPWGVPDENGVVTTDVVKAPQYKFFVFYTQADIDKIRETGLSATQARSTPFFVSQGGRPPAADTPVADIDLVLEVGEKYGDIFKGEGVAGLAAAIGIKDVDALAATLGNPEGTLYAACCSGYAYATVGGLDVNTQMNVLAEDGTPIEGLYAVGQDSEGVCNIDGKPYTPWGGQAQSWTFVSGRYAGTYAAGGEL